MKTIRALPKSGMKLKNGLYNIALIAGMLFCAAFINRWPIPTKNLHGVWHYRAIFKNGVNVLSPVNEDTMFLNTDISTFRYDIKSLNKHLGGTFQCISSPPDSSPCQAALLFRYLTNKRIRRFHIMLISDDSLIIREGKTSFHYSRKKP